MAAPIRIGQQQNLDLARQRWQDRYRVGQKYGIPLTVFQDAYKADLLSIKQGSMPMSDHDAFVATQGLMGVETETGAGKGGGPFGFLERASEDLKLIVHALPQLPKFWLTKSTWWSTTATRG